MPVEEIERLRHLCNVFNVLYTHEQGRRRWYRALSRTAFAQAKQLETENEGLLIRVECASCCGTSIADPAHFTTSIRSAGEREWACPGCGNGTPNAVFLVEK